MKKFFEKIATVSGYLASLGTLLYALAKAFEVFHNELSTKIKKDETSVD